MATYMDSFLSAIQRPFKKNMMKSNLFWKKFIQTAPTDHMCRFENGWASPRATQNFLASCVCGTAGQEQSTG